MSDAQIYYLENGVERFIRGELIEDGPVFVVVQLKKYKLTLNKACIMKMEEKL